jgi:hypothetical protein
MRLRACLVHMGVGLVLVTAGALGFSATAFAKATCSTNTGTITLSPGLTDTPAVQTAKLKGTLSGCTGEAFTNATYAATLKTTEPISCSLLPLAWETARGSAKFKWTPRAKASAATLRLLLTEKPEVGFSGEATSGPYSPLTFSGALTESYAGAATCSTKKVKKATYTGSAVNFA